MKRLTSILRGIFLLMFVSACGPSPEAAATMPASAWTATPAPTVALVSTTEPTVEPLPTLVLSTIPYELTVTVTNEQGAPIAGASIVLPESGKNEAVLTDEKGKFVWNNLQNAVVTLKISAKGYLPTEYKTTLERGPSELFVTLKPDPNGFLPLQRAPLARNFSMPKTARISATSISS